VGSGLSCDGLGAWAGYESHRRCGLRKGIFLDRQFYPQRLDRVRKNQVDCPQQTSAAKAGDDSAAVAARLKSCPSQNPAGDGVFPQPVEPLRISLLSQRGSPPPSPRNARVRGTPALRHPNSSARSLSVAVKPELVQAVGMSGFLPGCNTHWLPVTGKKMPIGCWQDGSQCAAVFEKP
jgi:hypothetical protein